jgi:hypothetical protein
MPINLALFNREIRERLAKKAESLNQDALRDRSPSIERVLTGAIKKVVDAEFPDTLNATGTKMLDNESCRVLWRSVVLAQINFWRRERKADQEATAARAEALAAAARKGMLFPI